MALSNIYSYDQITDMTVIGHVCVLSNDNIIACMSEKAIEAHQIE